MVSSEFTRDRIFYMMRVILVLQKLLGRQYTTLKTQNDTMLCSELINGEPRTGTTGVY